MAVCVLAIELSLNYQVDFGLFKLNTTLNNQLPAATSVLFTFRKCTFFTISTEGLRLGFDGVYVFVLLDTVEYTSFSFRPRF